jgi:hypothetical protein
MANGSEKSMLKSGKPLLESEVTFCLGADAFLDLVAGKWKQARWNRTR